MKKLVSLISALTMCAVMVAPIASSATDDATKKIEAPEKSAEVTVDYSTPEDFIITISDSVTLGGDVTVSATKAHLAKGAKITVTAEENGTLKYVGGDETDTLAYTIKNKGESNVIADAESVKEEAVVFDVDLAEGAEAKYAGTYSGTATFTISVSEGVQTPPQQTTVSTEAKGAEGSTSTTTAIPTPPVEGGDNT